MPKKTLYVSDEDEAVWDSAKRLGARSEASISRLVTLALGEYVASHPSPIHGGVKIDSDKVVRKTRSAVDAPLTHQVRELLNRFGRDRVALAFARACFDEGAREQAVMSAVSGSREKR